MQCSRPGFDSWVGKIPLRRKWLPTPVFLPGEACEQRSLVGCSPQHHKELDTEWLSVHTHTHMNFTFKKEPETSKTNICQLCLNFLKRKDYKSILNSLIIYMLKCLRVKVTDVYNSLWNASKGKMIWWLNRCSDE